MALAKANYQMLAFKVRGRVRAQSLFDVSSVDALTPRYDLVYMPGVMYHLTDPICAMLIVQSMLKPGGVFAFETAYAPDASGTLARYLGASVVGWNWWAPGVGCYNAMLHDAGFVQEHQVEQIGGRSWFMGIKGADTPPLVKSGAAGFSRPDILQRLARRP